MSREAISKKLRFSVLQRDNFKCQYCGWGAPDVKLQIDHMVAVRVGGKTVASNLVTACVDCNSGKGGRDIRLQESVPLLMTPPPLHQAFLCLAGAMKLRDESEDAGGIATLEAYADVIGLRQLEHLVASCTSWSDLWHKVDAASSEGATLQ